MICFGFITPQTAYCVLHPEDESQTTYILERGDRIRVTIYPEDEFLKGGDMEVSSEGYITLPLAGKFLVAGKTVIQAEKNIAEALAKDYLVDPEVVIEVSQYKTHSFVVLGAVLKPGTYQFPEGSTRLTLLRAISMSGGFSDVANVKKIKIMRKRTGEVIRANAESIISGSASDIDLEANDVIHVSESLF